VELIAYILQNLEMVYAMLLPVQAKFLQAHAA